MTRREGDQLRTELLTAARALVVGPRLIEVPSLRAVARAAGVSPTAVYRHFPSQADLTRALLRQEYLRFESEVLAADHTADPPATRLRRLALGYVRWGLANPGLYQLFFQSSDQLDVTWAEGVAGELLGHIHTLLAELRPGATETDRVAEGERLFATVHGLVSLSIHKPADHWSVPLEEHVGQLLREHEAS